MSGRAWRLVGFREDPFERLVGKLRSGEITHEEYARRLDELEEITERVRFMREVGEAERRNRRPRGEG